MHGVSQKKNTIDKNKIFEKILTKKTHCRDVQMALCSNRLRANYLQQTCNPNFLYPFQSWHITLVTQKVPCPAQKYYMHLHLYLLRKSSNAKGMVSDVLPTYATLTGQLSRVS